MKTIQMMAGGTGMGSAKEMAEMLRRMGRNGDTMLAHITPEEAELLADLGGAGTENPETGLPEFYNGYDFDVPDMGEPPDYTVQEYRRMTAAPEIAMSRGTRDFQQDVGMDFDTRATNRNAFVQPEFARSATTRDFQAFNPEETEFEQIPQLRTQTFRPITSDYSPRNVQIPSYLNFQPLTDDLQQAQTQTQPGFAQRAEARLKELEDVLNQYPRLTRAGTAGAGILAQALLFNRANRAMKEDIAATRRAAEPFRAAQQEAMARATGGGLTPEQEQDLEIAQARARQGLGERGLQTGSAASGVLAAQQRRARSLARQEGFQEALRLANIADQYDRRALEMELQRDQQLGQLFASIVGREVQQAQRETAPAAPAAPTAM